MEQRKSFFDYASQVLVIFAFTIIIMNIFCILFGEQAKGFSTLFSLGNQGISVHTAFQYLCMSALIVFYRTLFFTDFLIKKAGIAVRTVCLLLVIIITIAAFIIVFDWFPADRWECWGMFLLCFGISFAFSLAVTILKEREENRQMEKALAKLKQEKKEDGKDGICG